MLDYFKCQQSPTHRLTLYQRIMRSNNIEF